MDCEGRSSHCEHRLAFKNQQDIRRLVSALNYSLRSTIWTNSVEQFIVPPVITFVHIVFMGCNQSEYLQAVPTSDCEVRIKVAEIIVLRLRWVVCRSCDSLDCC